MSAANKVRKRSRFVDATLSLSLFLTVACTLVTGSDILAERARQKFEYIHENASHQPPDSRPTRFTESEINAYLASGAVRLPSGVQSVKLESQPGRVTGNARVDFDQIRAGRGGSNPLLQLFSGTHAVVVEADASGTNRYGHIHIRSVVVDGVEVPRFMLEMFVSRYISPRYPGVGLDSTFTLPSRIDTAIVGLHSLSVMQR